MWADEGDDDGDKWRLQAENGNSGFTLKNSASGSLETNIKAIGDGAVELYYDNVKTFLTNTNGIIVQATEGGDANLFLYADEGDDDVDKWLVQSESDGYFAVKNNASGSYETSIKATGNGAVELFYNDEKTFETIATGATITSSATTGITFTKPSGSAPQIQFRANSVDAASEIKVSESLGGGILEVKTKNTGGTLTTALTLDTSQNTTFASAIY